MISYRQEISIKHIHNLMFLFLILKHSRFSTNVVSTSDALFWRENMDQNALLLPMQHCFREYSAVVSSSYTRDSFVSCIYP